MTDFTDLLGQLMPSGISRSGKNRLQHAMGDQGLGGPGGLLSDLLGGGQSGELHLNSDTVRRLHRLMGFA
ncbi:MAG: hypothetical protein PVI13_02230 [Desulfobacterales bacterium]|jgi:hypothetical protein